MKLTEKSVALPPPDGKADHFYFDDRIPGFGLRIRGDARTWVYQYKILGHTRRMSLGNAKIVSFKKAFADAGDYHHRVKKGGDPKNERDVARSELVKTTKSLVEKYLEAKALTLRPRSYGEVKRHLMVSARRLHKMPITSVTKAIVKDRLKEIAEESGPVAANRVHSSLSAMFAWAIEEEIVDSNPLIGISKIEEKSRDRVLTDKELKIVLDALADDQYSTIIRLLLLTGQRANEIAGLKWSEIEFDRNVILLPGERTKNGRAHQVPMSASVQDILKAQPKVEGRALVFGIGEGPFSGWSKSKEAIDERIGADKIEHWTPHDLRRTVATRMADLGVLPHVIEAILNHVSGHKASVAGIYNRSLYTKEKADALALWDEHVSAVIAGRTNNITPMKQRA